MANIKRIENKSGVSYKITVTHGRDASGKQIRHYKTWTPAPGLTQRQTEKELTRQAVEFEREIDLGYSVDNRQTFSQYAEYVIDLKERNGAKHNTVFNYRYLMERISPAIGHIKLSDIRPQHLNAFYKNLSEEGVRKGCNKATIKIDLGALLKQRKISRAILSRSARISATTVTTACRGEKISQVKAEQIAKAIGMKATDLFKIERETKPLSAKSILEYHRFIHTVLDQAEREMLVPYNAASKASPPKTTQKAVNYFQPEEITAILHALEGEPIKWRTITHLLLVTGCRRGEIMGLKWDKVDFDHEWIKIDSTSLYTADKGIYESTTKTGNVRFVRLPAETMTLLRKYRAWQGELRLANGDRWNNTGYLFTQDDGCPMQPDSISAWLSEFSKRHGLKHINPHAFRHTVASVLINNGTDVVAVSKRLGHARTSTTTDIYAHIIQEADARASECLADVMLRSGKKVSG